jgi:hypothetical protein
MFKLVKALQSEQKSGNSLCALCVYFSGNLEPSYTSSNMPSQYSCGLDFIPGDDKCNEMRTNNCSARKK